MHLKQTSKNLKIPFLYFKDVKSRHFIDNLHRSYHHRWRSYSTHQYEKDKRRAMHSATSESDWRYLLLRVTHFPWT